MQACSQSSIMQGVHLHPKKLNIQRAYLGDTTSSGMSELCGGGQAVSNNFKTSEVGRIQAYQSSSSLETAVSETCSSRGSGSRRLTMRQSLTHDQGRTWISFILPSQTGHLSTIM
jgi:hypothetical protein